ncbi:MAG: dTDP-4-dehydrorhamnose 3,5-epimerase [Bacteroidetes bacterium]|nr:dTDP-4-dehydrorhamnose 3,5-epimerase [Bacteroidota bacterium]MBK8657872.1 dTDP-4-dehydrorhamnose 3,5-epimerase [Bacteroidota bacterium]
MPFKETEFKGLMIFEPRVFEDSRGYFFESFSKRTFADAGIVSEFVQDNESKSQRGVLRGLHYQLPPFAQAKLVRVVEGSVLDVVVDIRKGSPTYGQHFDIELSAENKRQLYIPHGFAHGFAVLSDTCIFQYKCDNYYSKESEGGILYNDPALGIDWKIDLAHAVVSDKDRGLPLLADCVNTFQY